MSYAKRSPTVSESRARGRRPSWHGGDVAFAVEGDDVCLRRCGKRRLTYRLPSSIVTRHRKVKRSS